MRISLGFVANVTECFPLVRRGRNTDMLPDVFFDQRIVFVIVGQMNFLTIVFFGQGLFKIIGKHPDTDLKRSVLCVISHLGNTRMEIVGLPVAQKQKRDGQYADCPSEMTKKTVNERVHIQAQKRAVFTLKYGFKYVVEDSEGHQTE